MFCAPAFGVYEVGDEPKNECWVGIGTKPCLEDATKVKKAQVLLYSAEWCAPCNVEFKELVPKAEKYAGKDVVFVSISAEANGGRKPDETFLKSWRDKFSIGKSKASWVVAGSHRDFAKWYFRTASIPTAIVIGKDGKVLWKHQGADVPGLLKQVDLAIK